MTEDRANGLSHIWRSQTREYPIMSTDEIRIKAHATQAKVRRNLLMVFALGVVLLISCVTTIAGLKNSPLRVIAASFIVLTCIVVYRAYDRLWSRSSLASNAAVSGCLEFYRRELGAQYRSLAIIWRLLIPVVLFAFFSWNAFLRTSVLLPRILLPSVLLLILFLRRLEVRKYKQKLAALDEFEIE